MRERSRLVTSTDYVHTKLPGPARLFNRAGRLTQAWRGPRRLQADELLASARRGTGLTDFGDSFFRAPLDVLLDSIEREAELSALGRAIVRGRVLGMLKNRLRIEQIVRAQPQLASTPIVRPIVIAGLQRTGTTMLHRLLAADPRARALAGWEALHPAPLPLEAHSGNWQRRAQGRLAQAALARLAPEFFAIHPVESEAPEEDVLLVDHSFASQASEAILHVPTYASWLERQDLTPAYHYLARILRVLAWQRGGQFWVLKTPHHMEYLHELLTVFPDAVIVQTHRDPQATMGSFCSMVAHGRGLFSDRVDPREIGRHWQRKVRRMIDRSLAVRDAGAEARFVDVSYYDLVADPLACVRRIYARAQLALEPDAEAAMRQVLERDVQHRHGRHAYTARDFGLSRAGIEETFADYRARFGIRHEKERAEPLPATTTGLGHGTLLTTTLTAFVDLLGPRGALLPVDDSVRLDGQTALVTGANAGLGKAVAIDLARRGARVLLACRSGVPQAGEEVARASGSRSVEMLRVDLSDLSSVAGLADELARRGERLDILVCNAGLMPKQAQATSQGHDVMFGVHYLANHLLVRRLLVSGVLPNNLYRQHGRTGSAVPRIVFVASETHRSAQGLDFPRLGELVPYGTSDAVKHYATSKLALVTFASELSRRLLVDGQPTVSVHCLCPGPVASSIVRDVPAPLQPVLDAALGRVFQHPEQAALPVVYLACAPEVAGETGWYLHFMQRKAPSPLASDARNGRQLWERGESMLAEWLGAAEPSQPGALS